MAWKNEHCKKMIKRIILIIMALVSTGAVLYLLWRSGSFLPGWIFWNNEVLYDRAELYEITLEDRVVKITYDNNVIWNSPDEVKVQQAMSCDIDHDQEEELVLLCWKRGRFGESRPLWMDTDEKKWSQHIFIYEYDQEEIRPKWMSSYIGQDVAEMAVCGGNIDGMSTEDGKKSDQDKSNKTGKDQAADGEYGRESADLRNRLMLTAPDGKVSSWVWDFWGFTKEETEVSFVVFGDNLIHEPIYRYGLQNNGNFDFLFENVCDMIDQSDIAVINQETPLTDDPALYGDYPRFGTPAGVGEAIADAGFDVVTCATNHALDRGTAGVDFTKQFFDAHTVVCLGIQSEEEREYRPYSVLTRNGIRFAMLNYTYGTNGIRIPDAYPDMVHLMENEDKVRQDIDKAAAESDLVIVFAHWGTEYADQPDDLQKRWTQIFLESGVDVVVGTHPHVLQPYEMQQDDSGHKMLVYYSIGNYVSAQHEKACVKGGAAQFTVSLTADGYEITEYVLAPLTILRQEDGRYTVQTESVQTEDAAYKE